ncbi:hypothetical protein BV22DRAFT_1043406 [Leucogyrophana mollusca]|uniref:Uncharacterized protein n=1 Tax=Leucogyrophana mollusca TaxID=85980 RepID=A0ACB8BYS8_9AGAM|nr:hypothetical protein BV22DRAFT_1043406 [Leucogyrophana mollusca]
MSSSLSAESSKSDYWVYHNTTNRTNTLPPPPASSHPSLDLTHCPAPSPDNPFLDSNSESHTVPVFQGHPTPPSNARQSLEYIHPAVEPAGRTQPAPDDDFVAVSSGIQACLENPVPTPLSIPCGIDLYRRLLDEGILLVTETSASFSYDSYRCILRIRTCTLRIHDVPMTFISSVIFSNPILSPLSRKIKVTGATTDFSGFAGRYKDSRKQPDVAVWTRVEYWPRMVLETGWSEAYEDLVADARMWLLGGRAVVDDPAHSGEVMVVILVSFTRTAAVNDDPKLVTPGSDGTALRIEACLEVWRRSEDIEDIKLVARHRFYPTNRDDDGDDHLHLTINDIVPLEYYIPRNISPTDEILFDLDILREHINEAIPSLLVDQQTVREINDRKRQRKEQREESEERERAKSKEGRARLGTRGTPLQP